MSNPDNAKWISLPKDYSLVTKDDADTVIVLNLTAQGQAEGTHQSFVVLQFDLSLAPQNFTVDVSIIVDVILH